MSMRLSNSTFKNKRSRNSSYFVVLHFTFTVGSSSLYLNIYRRKNKSVPDLNLLKIKPEITYKNINTFIMFQMYVNYFLYQQCRMK